MKIIPAIDIIDGKCVRLQKGDYNLQTTYKVSPLDMAKHFESLGATRLHVVDLDGAKASHVVNLRVLEEIASHTSLCIDFGGGIKHYEDLKNVLASGADMVTIGSIAATNPQAVMEWADKYGADHIIVGADALNGKIMIRGWNDDGGILLDDFIDKYMSHSIKKVLCTDISRDGMLQGPNSDLYKSIMTKHPTCELIASGGISSADDLIDLHKKGIPCAVFGKAYYEGRISDDVLSNLFKTL